MSDAQPPEVQWLSTEDLARMWQLSKGTISNWRLIEGKGPAFKRIGGTVRYHPEAVKAWEDEQSSK